MKRPKKFAMEGDDKLRDSNKKLRAQVRKLKKENKELSSQIHTLTIALRKTQEFLEDNLEGFSVEQCIDAAEKKKTLKQMKEENGCPLCSSSVIIVNMVNGVIEICSKQSCEYREKKVDNE